MASVVVQLSLQITPKQLWVYVFGADVFIESRGLYKTVDGDHGRIEERRHRVISDIE